MLGDEEDPPSAEAASTAGLVLLASSPPYGNSSLVGRTMRRRPIFSIKLTWYAAQVSLVQLCASRSVSHAVQVKPYELWPYTSSSTSHVLLFRL